MPRASRQPTCWERRRRRTEREQVGVARGRGLQEEPTAEGATDTLCAEGCGEDGDPTHEATRRAAQKEGGFCCLQMLQQKISKEEIIALCIHTEYR